MLIIARPIPELPFSQAGSWLLAAALHLCGLRRFPVPRGAELVKSHRCPALPLTRLLPLAPFPLGLSSLPFCFLPRPHTPPFSTLSLLQISISLPSTSHLEASALVVIFYSRRQLTSTPRIVFCFKKEIMHLLCAPGTVHVYTRGVCVCVCVCPQILLKGP